MIRRCISCSLGVAVTILSAVAAAQAGMTYSNQVLVDNPTAYYQFEETSGTQATDASGSALHGTYTGGVTLNQPGSPAGGKSMQLDGSTGYVQLPGSWGGADWEEMAIEAWVRPVVNSTSWYAVVSGNTTHFAHFQLHNTDRSVVYTNAGSKVIDTGTITPIDQWRHVVFSAESGDIRIYENGVRLPGGLTDAFDSIRLADDAWIGAGIGLSRKFNGQLDEVAIYKSALDDTQVLRHYYTATEPYYMGRVLEDQPVLYYRLSEADASDGAVAHNMGTAGSALNGQYSGSGFANVPSPYSYEVPAKEFDGSGTSVAVPAAGPDASAVEQFSVEFWMNPQTYDPVWSPPIQCIYAADGWSTNKLHLNLVQSQLEVAISGNGSYTRIDLAEDVPLDEWSHIVVTYDSLIGGGEHELSVYVDGQLIETKLGSGARTADLNVPGRIGSWYGTGRFFDGGLSDLAFYPYLLDPATIEAHFNAAVPEPGSLGLCLLGALGLGLVGRRRRRR